MRQFLICSFNKTQPPVTISRACNVKAYPSSRYGCLDIIMSHSWKYRNQNQAQKIKNIALLQPNAVLPYKYALGIYGIPFNKIRQLKNWLSVWFRIGDGDYSVNTGDIMWVGAVARGTVCSVGPSVVNRPASLYGGSEYQGAAD